MLEKLVFLVRQVWLVLRGTEPRLSGRAEKGLLPLGRLEELETLVQLNGCFWWFLQNGESK